MKVRTPVAFTRKNGIKVRGVVAAKPETKANGVWIKVKGDDGVIHMKRPGDLRAV